MYLVLRRGLEESLIKQIDHLSIGLDGALELGYGFYMVGNLSWYNIHIS